MTGTVSVGERLRALSEHKKDLLRLLREEKSRRSGTIRVFPRADGDKLLPSWAQQRLWFIDQFGGGSAGYYISTAVRLRGELNQQALKNALDTLVQRHEVLRTVFVSAEGDLRQVITDGGCFPLEIVDLSGYEQAQREAQVLLQKIEEARAKFDLHLGPLIRSRLIRVAAEEHLMLVSMHHIVSDGWSMGVLFNELAELYGAYREGIGHRLKPLPVQYADYAQWQRQWLQGEILEKQLSYWRAHLKGAAPQLELPTDRPRSAIQSYRGKNLRIVLDARLSAELTAFAQRHGMTLFMVLCAGWVVLLSRLSGQDDIVIGTPIANRPRPELEELIGFFVNTLVLRIEVKGDLRLEEFLAQVKKVTLGAYDHQDMPFEQLVEALQPQRSLSRNPLFQVMFGFQNMPNSELRLSGLAVTPEEEVCESSTFDLAVSLEKQGEQIVGNVNYASDLFDGETVERWMTCFTFLLKEMVHDVPNRVGDLSILPAKERHQVIDVFNTTQAACPNKQQIQKLFEEQVERTPEVAAVSYEGQWLTYAELNRRANQLAHYLRDKGVGADQLVALCVERSVELVVGLLGILKAGGAYVPLDPAYPTESLTYVLRDAAPKVLLTQERLRERLPDTTVEVIALDSNWNEISQKSTSNLNSEALCFRSHHLAYVIYTSGSTGHPKGVMIEHGNVLNFWRALERIYLRSPPCNRIGLNASFNFDASVQQLVQLLSGRTIFIVPQAARMSAPVLLKFLAENEIDGIDCTPSQLRSWVSSDLLEDSRSRLRMVLVGGEAIEPELWASLARCSLIEFYNVYGPTECTVDATVARVKDDIERPNIGRPMENRRIYILDRYGLAVPIGVTGEIHIGGPCVARGYLGRPELTAKRFLRDPFSPDLEARLYKTGDLGRWRADGTIEYMGRNDHQVKIRGFRIELGEIEAQLSRHSEVRDVVVVAREDVPGEKRLVAYVTLRERSTCIGASSRLVGAPEEALLAKEQTEQLEDNQLKIAAMRAHLKALLPEYMVPVAFVVMDTLPLTPNGKLDRHALPVPALDAFSAKQYEAPRGNTEEVLAGIWRELLHVARVGRHDNFFELGGHSLQGAKLIAMVTERFMVDLPGIAVFQHPTIQQMANIVERLRLDVGDCRGELVTLLEPASGGETRPRREPRTRLTRAPLAFSQLAHWRLFRLGERPSLAFLTSATRLQGKLNFGALQRSLAEMVRRHSALRTRIVVHDGIPTQEIAESCNCEIQTFDVTALSEDVQEIEVKRLIEHFILEPIDVAVGPLLKVRLFRLRDDEHVFVVAMEHIICDAFSMSIFLRDLFTGYAQALKGSAFSLPAIPVQFSDYAVAQRDTHQLWIQKHGAYWAKRLAGSGRLRFPKDQSMPSVVHPGLATLPFQIGSDLKVELREWCRLRQTTLVMGVFTAYVALVLRWCNQPEAVIQYQTNNRANPRIDNAIGYFATKLFLRIELHGDDSFINLMRRVTEEYCNAHEHADFSYIEAQVPRPEFAHNSMFNWVPQAFQVETARSENSLKSCPVPFEYLALKDLELDYEPSILFFDRTDEIEGIVEYSLSRFSAATMARFSRNLLVCIKALLRQPEQRVNEIVLS